MISLQELRERIGRLSRIPAPVLFLALGTPGFSQSADPFPMELGHGLMAGAVDDTTAILQSRLTSTDRLVDPRWSGVLGIGGIARFEVAAGADFKNSIRTEWLAALPENDYIVKVKVEGLRPETRHHFRLIYGPDKSRFKKSAAATFTTLGGETGQVSYSFALATCMHYSKFHYTGGGSQPPYSGPDKALGYPALASILALEPDFFVGLGDNVYYDGPGSAHQMRGRAETQHQLRMKHQEQYSQQRFLDLFARVATYWLKDDHDYRFNDSDPVNPARVYAQDRNRSLPQGEPLLEALRFRLRSFPRTGGPDVPGTVSGRRSTSIRYGDLLHAESEPGPPDLDRGGT